jgi:hypothetical protein
MRPGQLLASKLFAVFRLLILLFDSTGSVKSGTENDSRIIQETDGKGICLASILAGIRSVSRQNQTKADVHILPRSPTYKQVNKPSFETQVPLSEHTIHTNFIMSFHRLLEGFIVLTSKHSHDSESVWTENKGVKQKSRT